MKRLPPLNALRAFATAAQTGSFTKAGELLHVTQGAISRQVKMLEQHLDTRLFERAHQSVSLTPAGQALSDALLNAFGQIEEAVEKARQTPARQMLNINAPPTFATRWLAPRLSDFRSQYPFIDLSITTDRIQTLKSARQHDCLVFFDQAPWPDLACQRLMQEHHIMACSPSLWHGNQPPKLVKATLLHILDGDKRLPVWEHWDRSHSSKKTTTASLQQLCASRVSHLTVPFEFSTKRACHSISRDYSQFNVRSISGCTRVLMQKMHNLMNHLSHPKRTW